MKPFNLEAALHGEPLVTRDGRKVINFTKIGPLHLNCPYAAYIENEKRIYGYHSSGRFSDLSESQDDLFMAPKPKKKLWIAIDKRMNIGNFYGTSVAYESKEDIMSQHILTDMRVVEIEIEDE